MVEESAASVVKNGVCNVSIRFDGEAMAWESISSSISCGSPKVSTSMAFEGVWEAVGPELTPRGFTMINFLPFFLSGSTAFLRMSESGGKIVDGGHGGFALLLLLLRGSEAG